METHEALTQIRKLRGMVLDKRHFTGYSGKSKMVGGCLALATSTLLSSSLAPVSDLGVLLCWLLLGLISMSVNYLALFHWYGCLEGEERRLARLVPVVDALPSIIVGMLLTWALVSHSAFDLLFGVWMSLYGLTHLSYRILMPKNYYGVGLFYLFCGGALLLFPRPFLDPWPMGLVFFIGEFAGGWMLDHNRRGGA